VYLDLTQFSQVPIPNPSSVHTSKLATAFAGANANFRTIYRWTAKLPRSMSTLILVTLSAPKVRRWFLCSRCGISSQPDTMDTWDQSKLEAVIAEKAGRENLNLPTEIVRLIQSFSP